MPVIAAGVLVRGNCLTGRGRGQAERPTGREGKRREGKGRAVHGAGGPA